MTGNAYFTNLEEALWSALAREVRVLNPSHRLLAAWGVHEWQEHLEQSVGVVEVIEGGESFYLAVSLSIGWGEECFGCWDSLLKKNKYMSNPNEAFDAVQLHCEREGYVIAESWEA